MKRITLATDQIEAIRKIDNNGAGDRAGAYLALWQITGDPEALQHARIASFSGGVGGAAFGANLEIQKALGAKYPGVFSFSDQVFQSSMDNIEHNLDKINSGELSLSKAMFDGAQHAWAHVKLPNGAYENLSPGFPGNLFAWNPASSNRLDTKAMTAPGAGFAVEGANEADLYGKSLNDFDGLPGFSRHTLTNASGSSVVIVKDDHSGRTVYVGPGGDSLQTFADRTLIGDVEHPPQPRTDNYDYVQREKFLAIRQNEGPDTLSIGPSGVISIIKRAAQNAPIGLPSYPAAKLHAAIMANSPRRKYSSVAPVSGRKTPTQARQVGKHDARSDTFPGLIMRAIEGLPSYAKHAGNAAQDEGLAPISRYVRALASSPAASWRMASTLYADVTRPGGKYTSLAQGRPGSLIPELHLAQKNAKAIAPWAVGKASAAPLLSKLLSSGWEALPRIAPLGRQGPSQISTEQLISHHSDPALPNGSRRSAPDLPAAQKIDSLKLRGAIEELLGHQARLPPSGATAFDPRVTPAWPGLQLPA